MCLHTGVYLFLAQSAEGYLFSTNNSGNKRQVVNTIEGGSSLYAVVILQGPSIILMIIVQPTASIFVLIKKTTVGEDMTIC